MEFELPAEVGHPLSTAVRVNQSSQRHLMLA